MENKQGNENDYAMSQEEQRFLEELRIHMVVCQAPEASIKYAQRFLLKAENPFNSCIKIYAALTHEDRLLDILFKGLIGTGCAPSPEQAHVILTLAARKGWTALDSLFVAFRFVEHKDYLKDKVVAEFVAMDPQVISKFVIDLELLDEIDMRQHLKFLAIKGYFEQVDRLLQLHKDWTADLVIFLDQLICDDMQIDKKAFDEANVPYQAVIPPDASELMSFVQKWVKDFNLDKKLAPKSCKPPPFERLMWKIEAYAEAKTEAMTTLVYNIMSEKRISSEEIRMLKEKLKNLSLADEMKALQLDKRFQDDDFKIEMPETQDLNDDWDNDKKGKTRGETVTTQSFRRSYSPRKQRSKPYDRGDNDRRSQTSSNRASHRSKNLISHNEEYLMPSFVRIEQVDSYPRFHDMIENLNEDAIAMDTEGFNDGGAEILQIATNNRVYIVDLKLLKGNSVQVWNQLTTKLLYNDVKVFVWDFREDIRHWKLAAEVEGVTISEDKMKIVDLQVEAKSIEAIRDKIERQRQYGQNEKFGLQAAVEAILGKKYRKEVRNSDWSIRPLSNSQRMYAAKDAFVLLEIAKEFKKAKKSQ